MLISFWIIFIPKMSTIFASVRAYVKFFSFIFVFFSIHKCSTQTITVNPFTAASRALQIPPLPETQTCNWLLLASLAATFAIHENIFEFGRHWWWYKSNCLLDWFHRSGFMIIVHASGCFMYQLIYFLCLWAVFDKWQPMFHLIFLLRLCCITFKVRKPLSCSWPDFTEIKYARQLGNQDWQKGKPCKDGTSVMQGASGCQSLLPSFTWILHLVRWDGDRSFCCKFAMKIGIA